MNAPGLGIGRGGDQAAGAQPRIAISGSPGFPDRAKRQKFAILAAKARSEEMAKDG
jgi:hypothetical protein